MKRDGLNLEQDRMFLLVPSDITHTVHGQAYQRQHLIQIYT